MADEKRGKLGEVIEVRVKRKSRKSLASQKPDDRRYGLYPILDEIPRPQRGNPVLLTDFYLYDLKNQGNPTNRKDLTYGVEYKTISGSKSAWFDAGGNLRITENKNPKRIKLVGTLAAYPANFYFPSSPDRMARSGDVLVIPEFGTDHLTLVDASDPTAPALISRKNLHASLFGVNQRGRLNAATIGDTAYILSLDQEAVPSNNEGGFICAYDISDPTAPNQVASYQIYTGGLFGTYPQSVPDGIAVNGSNLYIGKDLLNVNPEIIVLNSSLSVVNTVSVDTVGNIANLFCKNNRLYVIQYINNSTFSKLLVYDVSSPASPALLHTLTQSSFASRTIYATDDGFVYVATTGIVFVGGFNGFEVIDASGSPLSVATRTLTQIPTLFVALDAKGRAL